MTTFDEIYNQSIKVSQNLIEDIRFSRIISFDVIKECADEICLFLNQDTNILKLLSGVQDKNPYMYSHPVNVALIAFVIGKWLYMNVQDLQRLVMAGLLHDIGKAKVKDSILNKSDPLTPQEMEIVKSHTTLGYNILVNQNIMDVDILSAVLSHHERQDGSGYPSGLNGNGINLFSRIIAVADIYDAITSTKVYRKKSTPFKAVDEINDNSFGHLDPAICHIFMNNLSNYYYGSHVRLNNELEGEIIYVNPCERTKPLIRCKNSFLNLTKDRNVEIVELL
jgi:putative nucleotidyltransferase with HDIG domain